MRTGKSTVMAHIEAPVELETLANYPYLGQGGIHLMFKGPGDKTIKVRKSDLPPDFYSKATS